jgi:ABC-2 type transport system permease protein
VFYSISLLPEFWQTASLLNPILYMVNAFRFGFLGVSDINLVVSYGISIAFIVILYSFSLSLLKRGAGVRS